MTGRRTLVDEKDLKIIEMLLANSRTSFTDIAKEIGITDVAVRKRVARLEKRGIIRKYTVLVSPKALGYNSISLTGIDTTPEDLFRVLDFLRSKSYARRIYLTSGDHMIMVEIWARDCEEMQAILKEIKGLNGVQRVCPAVVSDVIKEEL